MRIKAATRGKAAKGAEGRCSKLLRGGGLERGEGRPQRGELTPRADSLVAQYL